MINFENDNVLIEHLREGNEKAFMFLVDKFSNSLNAYAYSLIGDQALSKDIVQNVFLNTWKYRKRLNTKFRIKNFLYKSVYNEFINQYQKDKSKRLLHETYIHTLNEIVEETEDGKIQQLIKLVYNEIENLPPKCKMIFNMSKREGLTNSEISTHLGISIKTVENQITRAFTILRNSLGEKNETILTLIFMKKTV